MSLVCQTFDMSLLSLAQGGSQRVLPITWSKRTRERIQRIPDSRRSSSHGAHAAQQGKHRSAAETSNRVECGHQQRSKPGVIWNRCSPQNQRRQIWKIPDFCSAGHEGTFVQPNIHAQPRATPRCWPARNGNSLDEMHCRSC